jgi:hypothetical protein
MGLADSPSGQVGGLVQPVSKAKAATFFRDPNHLLYSADLATMNYTGIQDVFDECLLFTPSNAVLPSWFYITIPVTISSTNTLDVPNYVNEAYPDFVVLDQGCVSASFFDPAAGTLGTRKYSAITLNVIKTGACPGKICKPLPAGLGPVPYPDTPKNFLGFSDFETAATNAKTPTGYQNTFINAKAANNANGYLGYTTLPTYNVDTCSKKCDSIVGCQAFNIYFERDPKVEPGSGDYCNNPPSTTNIKVSFSSHLSISWTVTDTQKCSFWGGPVTKENAVNSGQWRRDFQIVIAGSNGKLPSNQLFFPNISLSMPIFPAHMNDALLQKLTPSQSGYVNNAIAPIPNYKSAAYYGNSMIVPPPTDCSSANPTLAWQLYNDGAPFAASRCAAACDAFSAIAKLNATADGNTKPILCNYFNTFIINKGNKALGQMCYLYSQAFKSSRATAKTQVDKDGNSYSVSFSYGFASSNAVGTCGANY